MFGMLARGAERWRKRVYDAARNAYEHEAVMDIEREGQLIVLHYQSVHVVYDKQRRGRFLMRDGKPAIRKLVEFALPTNERRKIGGPSKHRFAFLLDGVVRHGKEPILIVRYFTTNRDPSAVKEDLCSRMDVAGMAWAASKLAKRPVRVVEFDVVRAKAPSFPQMLKCRKCSGSGSIAVGDTVKDSSVFSKSTLVDCGSCAGTGHGDISTKACDTTVEIWESTLAKNPHIDQAAAREKAGKLLSELSSRGQSFSYRFQRVITDDEIDSWLADAYEGIREIGAARKRDTWPRNHGACIGKGGHCPYRDICTGRLDEGAPAFKIVKDTYPGLVTWND
jgi:hypothetical protein